MILLLEFLLITSFIFLTITKSVIYLIILILILFIFLKLKSIPKIIWISIPLFFLTNNWYQGSENELRIHSGKIIDNTSSGYFIKEENNIYFVITEIKAERNDHIEYSCTYNKGSGQFLYYLNSKFTSYYCSTDDAIITKHGNGLNNVIKDSINKYPGETSSFFNYLIFQETTDRNEAMIKKIGIYHLFVVSGFHISIFINSLQKFTSKFEVDNIIINLLPLLISLPFVLIIGPKIPSIRAYSYEWMKWINKRYQLNKTNVDIIAIQGIGFIFYNPYLLFNMSFVLSYLIVLFINLIPLDKRTSWNISILAFIISVPLISSMGSHINVLIPLMTIILTPIIIPGIILSCFIIYMPWIWFIFNYYFIVLYWILLYSSKISLYWNLGFLNPLMPIFTIMIYLSIILVIKNELKLK